MSQGEMVTTGYEDLTYLDITVAEGVALVTLNGTEVGNKYTPAGHIEMATVFPRLSLDERVRCVILTGADDAFCAGPSPEFTTEMSKSDPQTISRIMARVRDVISTSIDFEKPVIVALNGQARGAGLAFALLGDIIIAESHISISDIHVVAAAAAGDGGVLIWPMAMGLLRAKRYLFMGDPITADEAQGLGLVTEVVAPGGSLDRAWEYAGRMATFDQGAFRYTKRALNQLLRNAMPAYDLSWAGEILTVCATRPAEGLAAINYNVEGP
jgi:enoyl-CoA hydratase